jgi:type IV pilus assembly protein PilE
MRRVQQGGFTLIELIITVAIIAVLARIAFPAYTSHIQKGVRRSAQAQMLDLANREQQYLLANRGYAAYSTLTSAGYTFPTELSGKYTPSITVGSSTVPAFTVTFTAAGSQLSDGDLTYNSEGQKAPTTKW